MCRTPGLSSWPLPLAPAQPQDHAHSGSEPAEECLFSVPLPQNQWGSYQPSNWFVSKGCDTSVELPRSLRNSDLGHIPKLKEGQAWERTGIHVMHTATLLKIILGHR